MNPLYRHYRESGVILPPSPAGQTITVNPTFTPENQPLDYKNLFPAVDNSYEVPLMNAEDGAYAEIDEPQSVNCSQPYKPKQEKPKLTLDLSKCNLDFIDRTSTQNLYETPRCNNRTQEDWWPGMTCGRCVYTTWLLRWTGKYGNSCLNDIPLRYNESSLVYLLLMGHSVVNRYPGICI